MFNLQFGVKNLSSRESNPFQENVQYINLLHSSSSDVDGTDIKTYLHQVTLITLTLEVCCLRN